MVSITDYHWLFC